ncbi:MAG: ROK family protein, partial [Pseudothermotoga sp.]|nr:ROK family protein [Pseudothermotoga sp.]
GISYIKGVGKYEALYGVNVRNELRQRISTSSGLTFVENFDIFFENDTRLFALGWYVSNKGLHHKRVMFVTLGTGVGSAFIENGKLVTQGDDVPPGGYIYNHEFQGRTIEDTFSSRGILSLAKEKGLKNTESVKELSEQAELGNPVAIELFRQYGRELGEALAPIIERFKADALVIGGQIAKSSNLFLEELKKALQGSSVNIAIAEDSHLFTFIGAYTFFIEKRAARGRTV